MMGEFILGLLKTFWRGLAIVLFSPIRYPACALAWWIGGMGVVSLFMDAGLNPQSRSAVFMKWSEWLGPLMLIVYATLGFGFIGGPWCLLYHFLVGNLLESKRSKLNDSKPQPSNET